MKAEASISMKSLLLLGFLIAVNSAHAIPAFARKYGLPCSACHQAWPLLNNFGREFKDNGYQLGNERDSPVYHEPAYFPITFRTTPTWHRESNNRREIDTVAGNPKGGQTEAEVASSGFDLSSIDVVSAGTLSKNISFFTQPFIGNGSTFLNQTWVRFDNLAGSKWLNVKFGKFELDEVISQERILTLSNVGGTYYNYFFTPPGDSNVFTGIGGPQLGVELSGHTPNDYTRYSVAVVSSNNGQTGLPDGNTYDVYLNFTQGFEVSHLGHQLAGAYAYFGQSPTYFLTNNGIAIPGAGRGNRSFYRVGAYGKWFVGKFDFDTFYMHGEDNVYLGNSVPANQPQLLPPGAVGPSWNGGFVEAHYTYNKRLIAIGKYELVRMSRVANPGIRSNSGNLDNWTIGYRWYPIMNPRAGLAWVQEYSRLLNQGTAPISGKDDAVSSLAMGFDFDF